MFGLTGPQGNHGEDVKEYWWYLEGLPSHALLRWRYHYPQAAFPYDAARRTTAAGLQDPELELLDTGVFDDDRYWSVDVTYAKASPTEVLLRIVVENHGPDEATLDVLPTLWFRNTWSWGDAADAAADRARRLRRCVVADHALAGYRLEAAPGPDGARPRRSSARTRRTRRASSAPSPSTPYPKDGINDHVVSGARDGQPRRLRHEGGVPLPRRRSPAGGKAELRLRLHRPATRRVGRRPTGPATPSTSVVAAREADADEFYAALAPAGHARPSRCRSSARRAPASSGASRCTPTTCAAGSTATRASRRRPRRTARPQRDWRHLDSFDVLAMPDPWEYPWFAAWDLGFHASRGRTSTRRSRSTSSIVLLREWFLHPNGALPAYEWNFDDVNPPVHVHGRAARVPRSTAAATASSSSASSRSCSSTSRGGSTARTPTATTSSAAASSASTTSARSTARTCREGVTLEQADGTAWMAYYALSMLVIAIELARGERRLPGHGDQVPRAVRADRAGARPAGPVRRGGRVLLRPPRLPVGRVHARSRCRRSRA